MALSLRSGGESRLDGAPDTLLPPFADGVEALAQAILADDTDNIYGGDINLARQLARQQLQEMSDRSRAGQAAAAQAGANRNRARVASQGVVPESLPMDEYGAVSGRTVQEANRPLPEAEAALDMEQKAANAIIRGLREDTPVFGPQGDLDFLRERGERNPLEPNGRTDMAMRARIRERRGQSYELPDGTVIPVGREPTAAEIRSEREWQEWANEAPGTERQALYDPQAYEQFREGVRQDIQNRARQQMVDEGTGPTDEDTRGDLGLPALTDAQLAARDRRDDSESRVRAAQRGRFYRDKLLVDAGVAPPALGPDATTDDLERAAFRNRYSRRQADLDARKQALRDQRMLLAPGGRGVVNAINQLPDDWRRIAILDRITEGRVGGPTPLGVDAVGAQNALRLMGNRYLSGQQGQNGLPPGSLQWEAALAQQPIEVQAAVVRQQNGGVLPADSRAGMAVLDKIEAEVIGWGWGGNANVDRAVRRAVEMGIDPAEAEQRFRHRRYQDVPPRGVPEGVDPNDPRAWGPAPPGWAGRWPPE